MRRHPKDTRQQYNAKERFRYPPHYGLPESPFSATRPYGRTPHDRGRHGQEARHGSHPPSPERSPPDAVRHTMRQRQPRHEPTPQPTAWHHKPPSHHHITIPPPTTTPRNTRHGKQMIQQPDSLHKAAVTVQGEEQETAENTQQGVLQVAEDSTAQSIFTTKTSHWPVKIDSLLMPDQGKELKATVNPMPKYYKETFFAKDSLLHSELQGGRYGVAGDPVPYTLRNDDVLTPLLLLSILMLMLSVRRSSRFLLFQLRNFFHVVRTGSVRERESSADVRYLLFTEIYTTIILALLFFFYAKTYIAETYITYSEYSLMGMFLGVIIGLFAFEHIAESAVNKIFFPPRENSLWTSTKMTLTCLCGVLLTPMLLLLAYFGMSIENALLYTLVVIIIVKLLLFYKCHQIFFSKKGAFLQFFLYFCTLEIIPPLLAWGILVTIANILTVNY